MLEPFGPGLFYGDGQAVSFHGFSYPTRMAVARLSSGAAWVWSPVALTPAWVQAVEAIGRVDCIVSPNKLHHLFLREWKQQWPDARVYTPPGLARQMAGFRFDGELTDAPEPEWAGDIDQVVFRGSFAMEEVVFFHQASGTAIVGDLIQRFPRNDVQGWKGIVMRLDGLVGSHGSTPRDWRLTFLSRKRARAARQKVLGWQPNRLLIAHGDCAHKGAGAIIAKALSWL